MANILILEDDFVLAGDFSTALESCGHTVTVAGTATEGLEVARVERIDLAIVDIFIRKDNNYIPDGGLSLISKIRNTRGLKTGSQIPIIAISGAALVHTDHDPLMSALQVGASTTMMKPIDVLTLVGVVDDYLGPREPRPS